MNDVFSNESDLTARREDALRVGEDTKISSRKSSAMSEIITYTAADVHAEITAKVIMLMESLKKDIEEVCLPATIKKEKKLLSHLGFTNSKNMKAILSSEFYVNQINETRKFNRDRLKLIQLLHKHYGTDCMLMSLNDFMPLLKKYNLSCGFLEDYKGSIPNKNLNEILKAKKFTSPSWTNILKPDVNWIQERLRPYYRVKRAARYLFHGDYWRFPLIEKKRNDIDMETSNKSSVLLIAAPAQDMNTSVGVSNVRTEDPIVFSVTKQGVIIWSSWGGEGDDEAMKRYKALNDFLASHTIN